MSGNDLKPVPPPGVRQPMSLFRILWYGLVLVFIAALFVPVVMLSTNFATMYGYSVFVIVPVVVGIIVGVALGDDSRRGLGITVLFATVAIVMLGTLLLSIGFEGMFCLVMAAPLAAPLAMLGGVGGYALRMIFRSGLARSILIVAMFASAPLLVGMEYVANLSTPDYRVASEIIIDAPAETVWENVVSFPALPEPTETIFKLGVAYPKSAVIENPGPHATRWCVFNTGSFEEPITTWEPPTLLRFGVTKNPPAMTEWSPYGPIHPQHLEGFLVATAGEFRLEPMDGGRCRLLGTTWYQHGLWPASYWRLWSDSIIHRIHMRVLTHIKMLSEANAHHVS